MDNNDHSHICPETSNSLRINSHVNNDALIFEELFGKEADTVSAFVKYVNEVIRANTNGCNNPMSERTAMKFLIARKFNLKRAIDLYKAHEITRLQEGLTDIDITNDEDLQDELRSGKFTILNTKDEDGATIAIFTGKLHLPEKSMRNNSVKEYIHRVSLKGIIYQLDAALENVSTQLNGIVFIYNMNDSDYSNFDMELCEKILNLLKGFYPAKLKKVLVVSSPLWFKVLFSILSHVVKKKLRDRVKLLSFNQLKDEIHPDSLPVELGGFNKHDHLTWLKECELIYETKNLTDLCDPSFAQIYSKENKNSKDIILPAGLTSTNLINLDEFQSEHEASKSGSQLKLNCYDYDVSGMNLEEFYHFIKSQGTQGLLNEYVRLQSNDIGATFTVSSNPVNLPKNRYFNVKCYDHTRIILEPYDLAEKPTNNDPMDFINANYVDGYRQPRGYISTQGPKDSTIADFWRMIWQTGSRVIVMVTMLVENLISKCDSYWPTYYQSEMLVGVYKIEFMGMEESDDFIVTRIKLTDLRSNQKRDIWHHQFIAWPDFGIPSTGSALLKFRDKVLEKQSEATKISKNYPPITVHCSAGVGRSGTFITIDICIQQMETSSIVDVKGVVEKLREQRYFSIQTKEQYLFCYKTLYEYGVSKGLFPGDALEDSSDD